MENIKLTGSKNIRDLGGIKTKAGIISNCKILRGGALDNLTSDDIKILIDEYKLSTIIDLRTDKEIEEKKDIYIPNINYIHIPIFNNSIPGITHENGNNTEIKVDMKKLYQEIVSNEYVKKVAEVIKKIMSLGDNDYSILFHCTEGKDRTGIIAAIILLILEVDKETIVEDYLYTNIVNEEKAKIYYQRAIDMGFDKDKAEKIKDIFLAKREYIESIFDVIYNKWGGSDNFIKDILGLEEDSVIKFKQKLIIK